MAKRNYLTLALKGVAMGMADVIPGVSGGTIAFISGIYEELVNSIKNIDAKAVRLFFTLKFAEFWKKINGNFLLSIAAGIIVAGFSLAHLMTWLLESQPIGIWSFFFGLIIASTIIVSKKVTRWNAANVSGLILGAAAAVLITSLTPASTPDTWWFVLIAGAIAICAMILPGISGAFILVLLGKYHYILNAVTELNVGVILIFGIGAIVGLLSFSRLLSWLLSNFHNLTIAILTGFMAGSLNKIWPWKRVTQTFADGTNSNVEMNVWPSNYEPLTGYDPQIWMAAGLCVAGFLLIWIIEGVANKSKKMK